jgi:hypothetical protein
VSCSAGNWSVSGGRGVRSKGCECVKEDLPLLSLAAGHLFAFSEDVVIKDVAAGEDNPTTTANAAPSMAEFCSVDIERVYASL